jgi:DNA-binding CsgD family transcriptional regulator
MAGAVKYLHAGIDALEGTGPSDELFALHAARFLIDPPLNDPDRVRRESNELKQLAESLGTARARTEALIGGVSVLYGGCSLAILRQDAEAQGAEALRIAEEAGDMLLARRAHRDLGWLALYYHDHAVIRLHAQAQIEIDRRLGDIAHEPAALFQLGYAEVAASRFDEGLKIAEEAVAKARRYDQRRSLAMSLAVLALAETRRGDLDTAGDHLSEARQLFPQLLTDPRGTLVVGWPQATFAFERGDFAEVRRVAGRVNPPMTRVLLGVAQIHAGDLEGAMATQAEIAAGAFGEPYPLALADRLLGLIEQARGETESAREHLERAAATMDTLALPFEAAVARLEAGTKENVSQALAVFEVLGAARYADKARRALRALGVRLPSARSGRSADQPLSRREMEVARLVAEGLTNAEIAERLVLSVRTIESHLDHVYARLGMSSRAALARWVTEGRAAAAP